MEVKPQLAIVGGRPYVFYVEPGRIVRRTIDARTGAIGPMEVSWGLPERVEWTHVAGSTDGGFLVAWNEAWNIEVRAYGPDGSGLAPALPLTDNGRYPLVASDGERWIVGFHELSDGHVTGPLVALFDSSGAPASGTSHLDGDRRGMSLHVARRPEGLVGVWAGRNTVRFAELSDTLRPLTVPLTVYDTGSFDGARVSGAVAQPSGTVVAFHDGRLREGGFLFVPSGDPSGTVVLHASDSTVPPRLGFAGDVAIGFEAHEQLRVRRLVAP